MNPCMSGWEKKKRKCILKRRSGLLLRGRCDARGVVGNAASVGAAVASCFLLAYKEQDRDMYI